MLFSGQFCTRMGSSIASLRSGLPDREACGSSSSNSSSPDGINKV